MSTYLLIGGGAALAASVVFLLCNVRAFGSAAAIGVLNMALAWAILPTLDAGSFQDLWWWAIFFVGVPTLARVALSYTTYHENYRYREERDATSAPRLYPAIILVAGTFITFIVTAFTSSSSMMHADRYRDLLGKVVTSKLDEDVAPVDIHRIRQVPYATAAKVAAKLLGADPGLGSRVVIGELTSQALNGCFTAEVLEANTSGKHVRELCFDKEIVYIAPLDPIGFIRWFNNGTTDGYIVVSAVDANKAFIVTGLVRKDAAGTSTHSKMGEVKTESTAGSVVPFKLRYLEGSYWGDNIVRHVYANGYATRGITDYSLEVDDQGKPWYVIAVYANTVGFSGSNVTSIAVVDPETGAIQEYPLKDAPTWIERIQPKPFVESQIDDWGNYVHGWWNQSFGQGLDLLRATPGVELVEGADGQAYFYTGITSAGRDSSTVGFMLVNTRTKEARWYQVGGAAENAAAHSMEQAKGAKEAGYSAVFPILYRVEGQATYFSPLLGNDDLPKMYGFVNLARYDIVGVGNTPTEALRNYQRALMDRGLNVSDVVAAKTIEAVVSDIATELTSGNPTYYLLLQGHDGKEFYAPAGLSPELKWVRVGDTVRVTAQEGEHGQVPLSSLDNLRVNLK